MCFSNSDSGVKCIFLEKTAFYTNVFVADFFSLEKFVDEKSDHILTHTKVIYLSSNM